LLNVAARGQRLASIEKANIIEAEKAALEDVLPWESLRLTHQVKVINSL